jgi:hypothetical protein
MAKVLRRPRKQVLIRARTARTGVAHFGYGFFRFAVYGFLGVALEIVFYNLVRNGQSLPVVKYLFQFQWRVDPALNLSAIWEVPARSLYGQCSLWMFPVYAVASFCIEFLYRNFSDVHWGLRALGYGLAIVLWECLSGWLLYWGTGFKIWYYADAGNFYQMTSWYILPIWCVTGLLVEYLYRQLMDPDLVQAIETASLEPQNGSPAASV